MPLIRVRCDRTRMSSCECQKNDFLNGLFLLTVTFTKMNRENCVLQFGLETLTLEVR
jgi:hypothetical protein